ARPRGAAAAPRLPRVHLAAADRVVGLRERARGAPAARGRADPRRPAPRGARGIRAEAGLPSAAEATAAVAVAVARSRPTPPRWPPGPASPDAGARAPPRPGPARGR